MASSINASLTAGVVTTADTSGVLNIQTAGTTAISIDASQAVSFTNSPTVTGGTANGVAYLNGSKVLTTGSALVFDGTNLGLGVTPSAWNTNYKGFQVGAQASIVGYAGNYLWAGCNWVETATGPKYIGTGNATLYVQNAGLHAWSTSASGTAGNAITFTQAMTLDASGNLLVGTTSSNARITVKSSGNTYSTGALALVGSASGTSYITSIASNLYFSNNGSTDHMVLDSSGVLTTAGNKSDSSAIAVFENTANVNGNAAIMAKLGSNCSTTSSYAFIARTGAVDKLYIYGNGNVVNTNNSYGSLSDAKLKENVTDCTPKLDKLNQVRIVNYNLKESLGYEPIKQIGVIAQELELIFPGLVDETPDRDADGNILKTTTKSVKYSVFVPMLIKAIQEQQALITQLQADVAALKGASA